MAAGKKFLLKIYNRSGSLVATHDDVYLSGFDWALNGGQGELTVRLAKKIDAFGEISQVDFRFRVKVFVFDKESPPDGTLLYQGYIVKYRQIVHGSTEYVELVCFGYQTLLDKTLLKSGSTTTTVAYSGVDPSYIVKDAISKGISDVTAPASMVQNTGQSLSYSFRANSIKEVLDKVIDLAPDGFYWLCDANNQITFQKANFDKPDWTFQFGRDFTDIQVEKSMEEMTNAVYFIGGGNPNLFNKYSRTSGQSDFGVLEAVKTDERVTTNATAAAIAATLLDKADHPKVTIKMTISDSNLNILTGKNIDIMKPGQIVQIRNLADPSPTLWDVFNWDIDFWDFSILGALANPLVIRRVSFSAGFDEATLELGDYISTFMRQYVAFEDKVAVTQYQNLPATPS
jgi:hypothetical protein